MHSFTHILSLTLGLLTLSHASPQILQPATSGQTNPLPGISLTNETALDTDSTQQPLQDENIGNLRCDRWDASKSPHAYECVAAFQDLPIPDITRQTFTAAATAPPGQLKLPIVVKQAKCVVTLDFDEKQPKQDSANWLVLRLAALELLAGCTKSEYGAGQPERSAGRLVGLGEQRRLRFTIGKDHRV